MKFSIHLTLLITLVVFLGGCVQYGGDSKTSTDTTGSVLTSTDNVTSDKTDAKMEEKIEAAPLPDTAKGPAMDFEKGYLVEHLGDGLYWVSDGAYQVIFLTTGEGVIAVDAPPTMGAKYLAAIAEVTNETVTHVIYSHAHADHISAASMFPENATYIAHEQTKLNLERSLSLSPPNNYGAYVGGGAVPLPTVTFTDNMTLTVGNQTLELSYKGNNHQNGNIFIYAPKQKTLMLVDVVFPGWAPFFELAVAQEVTTYVSSHDDVLSYDFETFVGGHITRTGTREDVEVQKEYILDMQNNAAKALQTVDFFKIAEKTGFENSWLLFGTYLEAVKDECTKLTLEKWEDRLGGADIVTPSHCSRLIESLRID